MTKRDSKFDEIDRMFEELQRANDETAESIRSRLSDGDDLFSLHPYGRMRTRSVMIRRPTLPSIPSTLRTRLDIFLYCLKNVDYAANNSAYVDGHLQALNSYLEKARLNANNLEVVAGTLNDEIRRFGRVNKTDIREKGYYDGLSYVNQALKRSKEIIARQINDILKRELV